MKIVVFESEEWERPYFDALKEGHEVIFDAEPIDEDSVSRYADADIVSPFVYSDLSRPVLEKLPQLKFIATRSTGFDHIDLEYCAVHDIRVSNVPTYGERTVAEHVFALLLSISHKIPQAVNRTRQGDFSQKGLQGFDLGHKTMGIIGTGNIGLKTIRIARGFEMNVIACDRNPNKEAAADLGFTYVDMPELLAGADIISLHVPGNKHTHHLLSTEQFKAMKDGVVLINTARGTVVDIKALLHALADGKVAAAGLDVLAEEPAIREEAELLRSFFTRKHDLEALLADHVLLHMKNVIITPHSAFNTKEAVQRILKTTVGNIEGFLRGEAVNPVESVPDQAKAS
ncbi:MAG: hydroxyacid dehydrogenase [Rhodospirillales bacterium]|nr:hydroxyacid dehydrogenase [Rhodospirillales bacterium]MCB9996787.1 hydroxyacid dehydrogenase [Rhodospirillales bacterium]